MRSTVLEVIFKKNKTFRENIVSKTYFELDKYAHKSENPLSQPHTIGTWESVVVTASHALQVGRPLLSAKNEKLFRQIDFEVFKLHKTLPV